MRRRRLLWFGGVAALLVVVGAAALLFSFWQQTQARLPEEIQRKVNFFVYLPEEGSVYELDRDSLRFDDSSRVLSFVARSPQGTVSVTQQATPEAFQDIPNYYSQLLDKLHQYEILQTGIGTVTLTRPEELKGLQTAVANPPGTLLFARPEKDLSSSEWKAFFDSLEVVR
jgi:hypothetical protein